MKVLLRFQSPYDKYLFEGIITPEDYYGVSGLQTTLKPETPEKWVGSVLNNKIIENSNIEEVIALYILNTLDHNIKIEPDNPDNILTKFFKSMQETLSNRVIKNVLLISIQHPKVLNNIIEYFTSLEKKLRPHEDVIVYTISSYLLKNALETFESEPEPTEGSNSNLYDLINSYGKHTFIDLSLSLTAIELFKRRKLINIYGPEIKELKGIGTNLLNHFDKKINTGSNVVYVPKVKVNTIMFKNIHEFLTLGTEGSKGSKEGFNKRLLPLIPKFNYRIYDKLETFYIKSFRDSGAKLGTSFLEKNLSFDSLYNILIIKNETLQIKLSFKILLYISLFKWNLIFIQNDEVEEKSFDHTKDVVSDLFEQLSQIYNDKSFETSRNELRKLNSDYSLLRKDEEYKYVNSFENSERSSKIKTPHIIVDKLDSIKNYIKKLESSLKVDNIKINVLYI
jgi:hypothetical protein